MTAVIADWAELDGLPVGTLFLTRQDIAWEVMEPDDDGDDQRYRSHHVKARYQSKTFAADMPVIVVYSPVGDGTRVFRGFAYPHSFTHSSGDERCVCGQPREAEIHPVTSVSPTEELESERWDGEREGYGACGVLGCEDCKV